MAGVLYIVATPIGNLADISHRAEQILRSVDLVAAEDTRHSKLLLGHLGIKRQLLSYHQHNEQKRTAGLLQKLQEGNSVALISDAGTPLISDPGYTLVSEARKSGIDVIPIPGACSIITALSASGLPTDQFSFIGFLAGKDKERLEKLSSLKALPGTLVLLESTHRICRLLEQIGSVFGGQRLVVAKELTKTHERFFDGSAADILAQLQADERLQKGEFVVLIDNPISTETTVDDAELDRVLSCLAKELPVKKAAAVAAELTGFRKNDLYQRLLSLKEK